MQKVIHIGVFDKGALVFCKLCMNTNQSYCHALMYGTNTYNIHLSPSPAEDANMDHFYTEHDQIILCTKYVQIIILQKRFILTFFECGLHPTVGKLY